MGRLRDEPRGVGSGFPRLRLHRRALALARRRHARGQRRLLAALAPPARSAAGSADRPGRGRGRDDLPCLSPAARSRARHPLRRRGAGRALLVRGGVSDRQAVRLPRPVQLLPCRAAGGAGRAGAGIFRRDRALAAVAIAAAQLRRARAMVRRRGDRAAHRRRRTRRRGDAGAARAGQRRRGARTGDRTQRPLPLRQRTALQALPRRVRRTARHRHACVARSGARRGDGAGAGRAGHAGRPRALRPPARRPRRGRARLPRGACRRAAASPRAALPRRHPLPA